MTASLAGTGRSPSPWRQSWVALVLTTLSRVLLGALGLLLAASVLPAAVGWQSSVVMSGSMAPALTPGDVAVVRPVDSTALRPSQVLLVDDPDVPGRLRVHRLVAVEDGGLRLRGDANPAADGSLVAPSAVHGVVTVGLPLVGRPAVWLAEGRVRPLVGTAAGLAALLGLALLHCRDDEAPTGPPAAGPGRPRRPRRLRRGTVLTAAVAMTVSLPGASAGFSDQTRSPALTFPVAAWWNCTDVAVGSGAAQYYRMQETWGSTAINTGTSRSAGNATYSGGVSSIAGGPPCGEGDGRAITFDGQSGQLYATALLTGPQTFSVQTWFRTSSVRGGKLVGFGNGADGSASTQYDRHVYTTDDGRVVFGVYNDGYFTVTSPRSYRDGAWHLATATFSPTTGMRLYLDGALVGSNVSTAAAEDTTGHWRIGYDTIGPNWPGVPTSERFAGSLAHVSVYGTVLTATQVRQAWDITR